MDRLIDGWMDSGGWVSRATRLARYTVPIYLSKVKNAVEQSYQCLGITCIEVGGLWNPNNGTGAYRTSASPCVDSQQSQV